MDKRENEPITDIMRRWRDGDQNAAARLLPLVYSALHGIARRQMEHREQISLIPTELVHEAFIKLNGAVPEVNDRLHFFAIAARAMRQVLVDHEIRRRSDKRSGERVLLTTLDTPRNADAFDLIALDQALTQLQAHDERKARAIEMRTFGGLEFDEIAQVLGISRATLARDYRAARAWLGATLDMPLPIPAMAE